MRRFLRALRAHVKNGFSNWRTYDAPLGTKLWLMVRNRLRATLSVHQCCGRPGQPGC